MLLPLERLRAVPGKRIAVIANEIVEAVRRLAGEALDFEGGIDVVVAGHHDIDPTFEIERLTGQPAHRFDDFVRDHRDAFARHGS